MRVAEISWMPGFGSEVGGSMNRMVGRRVLFESCIGSLETKCVRDRENALGGTYRYYADGRVGGVNSSRQNTSRGVPAPTGIGSLEKIIREQFLSKLYTRIRVHRSLLEGDKYNRFPLLAAIVAQVLLEVPTRNMRYW